MSSLEIRASLSLASLFALRMLGLFLILPVFAVHAHQFSGGDSLTSSLLATAGLNNAAGDLGYKLGGFASLETIVSLRPAFLLVSDGDDFAEDEGRAFMLHPALERFYPASKRLVIPEKLTVCGGPMLSEALDRLASELERVAR